MPKLNSKTCTVVGCNKYPSKGRGLCNTHYLQYRRGKLVIEASTRHEQALKFIETCLGSGTDQCIEPPKGCSESNYPIVKIDGVGRRIGWIILERTVGTRPRNSLVMRHLCGNHKCCNPRHLAWGTEKQNAADRKVHGTEPNKWGRNNPNYRHGGCLSGRKKIGPAKGERHGNSKLTKELVLEIRRRLAIGGSENTNSKLASEFRVAHQTISKIHRRKLWSHV